MKLIALVIVAILIPFAALAQDSDNTYTFSTVLSAPGSTENYNAVPDPNSGAPYRYPKTQTVQAFVTGAPTACSFQLFGTTKALHENPAASDFVALGVSTSCTTPVAAFIVDQPMATVQVRLSALSGGTTPTVTFRYLAKR